MKITQKYGRIFLISIILILSTSACERNSDFVDITDLQQYKTDYIGDASNVANIVSHQDYPKGYSYDYIEIQSETEPYGLNVYLKAEPNASKIKDKLQTNADITFHLIGNLKTLDFIDSDCKEVIASYEASE